MKSKGLFVVLVDSFRPPAGCLESIVKYANRIGADFMPLTQREFTGWPAPYEKLQVHNLGKEFDHCVVIDADTLVDPRAPDFTEGISPGYVGALEAFSAKSLFHQNYEFLDDGRNIGIASNFVVTDRLTHDLWEPLQLTWNQARIYSKRDWIIDEYAISWNLARHRFKFTGLNYSPEIRGLFKHFGTRTPPSSSTFRAETRP